MLVGYKRMITVLLIHKKMIIYLVEKNKIFVPTLFVLFEIKSNSVRIPISFLF